MSFLAGPQQMGIWPMQHFDPTIDPAARLIPRCVRIIGYRRGHAIQDGGPFVIEPESYGDVTCWVKWSPDSRDFCGWANVWPASASEAFRFEHLSQQTGTTTGTSFLSPFRVLPILNSGWEQDDSFAPLIPAPPSYAPTYPRGWGGVVVGSTDTQNQHSLWVPGGYGLVAVHRGNIPDASSRVFDLDGDEIDEDVWARISTAWRVVRLLPVTGANALPAFAVTRPPGNIWYPTAKDHQSYGLGWELGQPKGGFAGFGLVSAPLPRRLGRGGQPLPLSGSVHAFMSARAGGPLDPGDATCAHRRGETAEFDRVNAGHLNTQSLFWNRDKGWDGPLDFEDSDMPLLDRESGGARLVHLVRDYPAGYPMADGTNHLGGHVGRWYVRIPLDEQPPEEDPPPLVPPIPPQPRGGSVGASGPAGSVGDIGPRGLLGTPRELSVPAIVWRAQPVVDVPASDDYRSDESYGEEVIREYRRRPIQARLEIIGHELGEGEYSGDTDAADERYRGSPGHGDGVLALLPGNVGAEDYGEDYAPADRTIPTVYLCVLPSGGYALGIPDPLTGGVKDGFLISRATATSLLTQYLDGSGSASSLQTLSTAALRLHGIPLELPEISTPATPASGYGRLYFKADGKPYSLDDSGTETDLTAGGGGASLPVDDTTSLVQDPVDNTKQTRLDTGAVSTSTVRTITMPDQDVDLTPDSGTYPSATHASRHTDGSDDIQDATVGQKGLMTAAQASKLDGIEALADVTDEANVLAALAASTVAKDMGGGEISETEQIQLEQLAATPATPAGGHNTLYMQSDRLYSINTSDEPRKYRLFKGARVEHRTDWTITYSPVTRQFTVTATDAEVDFWGVHVELTFAASTSSAHANTTGSYVLTVNAAGTLAVQLWDNDIIVSTTDALLATCYYNATDGFGVGFSALHEDNVSAAVHRQMFFGGARYSEGFGDSGYTLDTDGSAAQQLAIAAGEYGNAGLLEQISALVAGSYTAVYRVNADANGEWNGQMSLAEPHINSNPVGGVIRYNELSGGSWGLSSVPNTEHVNYYCVAVPALSLPEIYFLVGQSTYKTLHDAQAETVQSLDWGAYRLPTAMIPLYQITYRRDTTYADPGQSHIMAVRPIYSQTITPADEEAIEPLTEFSDEDFVIYNNLNTTKRMEFELAEISDGQTRVWRVPDSAMNWTGVRINTTRLRLIDMPIEMTEIATPATPSSARGRLYFKSDGHPYGLDDAGIEYDLTETTRTSDGPWGTGGLGDVTISSDTSVTPGEFQYANLTVNTGITLDVAGSTREPWVIRVSGTLTINGTIQAQNGGSGTSGGLGGSAGNPGGASLAAISQAGYWITATGGGGGGGGSASNAGGTGGAGQDRTADLLDSAGGGSTGSGGAAGGSNGSNGGNDSAIGARYSRHKTDDATARIFFSGFGAPGTGGGGGAGEDGAGGNGGDGGAGGGCLYIYARTLVMGGPGEISAQGGDGENGITAVGGTNAGGGGGGSPGGGGLIVIVYGDLDGDTISSDDPTRVTLTGGGIINARDGARGDGGEGDGAAGDGGRGGSSEDGHIVFLQWGV